MNSNNIFPNPFDQDPLPPWDKNAVWQQIETQLPPRQRRRLVIWWLASGLVGLVAFVLYSFPVPPASAQKTDPIADAGGQHLAPVTERSLDEKDIATNTEPVLVPNALFWKKNDSKTAEIPDLMRLKTQNTPNNTPNTPSIIPNYHSDTALKSTTTTSNVHPMAAPDPMASSLTVQTTTTITNGIWSGLEPTLITILPTLSPIALTSPLPELPLVMPHFQAATPPKTPTQSPIQWLIGGDLGITHRQIRAISAAGTDFANAHRAAIRPLETAGIQAGVQYHLTRKWAVGTGLRYQSTQHWFDFSEITARTEQIPSDSASVYSVNGISYYQNGLVTKTTTTTRSISSPGRMERIFVPVWVHFTAPKGFYGQINLLLNVYNQYRGFALHPQGTVIEKNDRKGISDLYRKTGAHATRLELGYRLRCRIGSIQAGMYYQTDIGSVMSTATYIRQRDGVTGLTVRILR